MNVSQVFELHKWVGHNREWIMSEENPTLKEMRRRAEAALGFRCTEGNVKQCMVEHEIPVRRSKAESEKLRLEERCKMLEQCPLKIASYTNLPLPIAKMVQEEFDLNAEIADALKLNRIAG